MRVVAFFGKEYAGHSRHGRQYVSRIQQLRLSGIARSEERARIEPSGGVLTHGASTASVSVAFGTETEAGDFPGTQPGKSVQNST